MGKVSAVWVLPVLGEEVDDVKGGSVHQSHGQMKGCLTLFLPQQTKQERKKQTTWYV